MEDASAQALAEFSEFMRRQLDSNVTLNGSLQDILNNATWTMPDDMRFNDGHRLAVVAYAILIVFGGIGNLTVLAVLLKRSTPKTRINKMLIHLAIADLAVVFLLMPVDLYWNYNVEWKASDFACRIANFARTFGLYLSGFVLMCISIDRYYAVLKPLQLRGSDKRIKYMLITSWVLAFLFSLPQCFVFGKSTHGIFKHYTQCVAFDGNPEKSLPYTLFNFSTMYVIPFFTFVVCYSLIIKEIIKKSKEYARDKMRRSSVGYLEKARVRTVKMTLTILCVFFVCWTPYYLMTLWYIIDGFSAAKVDFVVQKGLMVFAAANSCMNPLVYGLYNIRSRTQTSSIQSKNTEVCYYENDNQNKIQKETGNILPYAVFK